MKNALKLLILLLLTAFMGCKATAQKFTTHAVEKGETLYSVARKYNVAVDDILRYNKEISREQTLKPNTILVVPVKPGQAVTTIVTATVKDQDSVDLTKPVGFDSHRVRRKETLYNIANRYDVKVDDLKRYNPELYSGNLQKGMVLKIPKFPEKPEEVETDYLTYVVKPKETRWSIANKFGITIDSLLQLNPQLPKTTNHLAEGQELQLPKPPGSDVGQKETQLYVSYQVPPKKTLFSLSQEYKISREEIIRLNPEIMERGGLQEGMEIRLPQIKPDSSAVNTDNFIFYEVKPRMTEFSLTRKLNMGYNEIKALNPELANGLKAGMVLKLPKEKAGNLEVKNALVLDRFDLKDSMNTSHVPRLLVLLPFRLNKLNLSERNATAEAIERSNALKYSLGLYSGMLVALDSVRDMGLSVELKTYDTELSLPRVKSILLSENLENYSAIVGPLDTKALNEVASQTASLNVPVVAPIPINSDISMGNVFFTYTGDEALRKKMLDHLKQKVTDERILIIADEKNRDVEEAILEVFPAAELLPLKEEEENISLNMDQLLAALSEENENWVIVETDNFKVASSVSSILNSVNSETTRVRMFTTNPGRAFDDEVISVAHLSNLKFTYPSVYKVNGNDSFVRRYRSRFGDEPDRYATRGFDLGMDLLLRLAYKVDLFEVSDQIGVTEYTGNKFDYIKDLSSGYYNVASYILEYNDLYINEVQEE